MWYSTKSRSKSGEWYNWFYEKEWSVSVKRFGLRSTWHITKFFSDLYLSKFLNTSAKSLFPCVSIFQTISIWLRKYRDTYEIMCLDVDNTIRSSRQVASFRSTQLFAPDKEIQLFEPFSLAPVPWFRQKVDLLRSIELRSWVNRAWRAILRSIDRKDSSPRGCFPTLKKENEAARSRAERSVGIREVEEDSGESGPFADSKSRPETNSRKIYLLECEEGNKTRVACLECRRDKSDVACVCACASMRHRTRRSLSCSSPHLSSSREYVCQPSFLSTYTRKFWASSEPA